MRRLARGNPEEAMQLERIRDVRRHRDVADVGRIERAAEETDPATGLPGWRQDSSPFAWISAAASDCGYSRSRRACASSARSS